VFGNAGADPDRGVDVAVAKNMTSVHVETGRVLVTAVPDTL